MITVRVLLLIHATVVFGLDSCKRSEGNEVKCILGRECSSLKNLIKSGKRPAVCGFEGTSPKVCCPMEPTFSAPAPTTGRPASTTPSVRISNCGQTRYTVDPQLLPHIKVIKSKCVEYSNAVFEEDDVVLTPGARPVCSDRCKNVEALIVGGRIAKEGQFPHMALIGYGKYEKHNARTYSCGGSLISDKFILTAAHCLIKTERGFPTWVRLGEVDLANDYESVSMDYFIEKLISHPEYTVKTHYYDIGLIQLKNNVNFNGFLRPACLKVTDHYEKDGIASGWGKTSLGSFLSEKLMYVRLNLVNFNKCNEDYNRFAKLPNGILNYSQICYGDTYGKDVCLGDSGGPVQVHAKEPYCMFEIVGVTSLGRACGQATPGIFTKVTGFLRWIVPIVWPDELEKELSDYK